MTTVRQLVDDRRTARPAPVGTTSPIRRSLAAASAVGLLAASALACSTTDDRTTGRDDADVDSTDSTSAATLPTFWSDTQPTGDGCRREKVSPAVSAVAVPGSDSDSVVTSFDGTEIRVHWFPHPDASATPHATVMMGPGWGLAGDSDPDAVGPLGIADIGGLRRAGFNVLTWDPRGFGQSGGAAQINDPSFEGRDVQYLLDWLGRQPEVMLDGDGDPTVGMIGGSYGGGIPLVAAAIDCRVDAIVPVLAWNDLLAALFRGETMKIGWGSILVSASAGGNVAPEVTEAFEQGSTSGHLDPDLVDWFASRGPGELVSGIAAPTLVIQGTTDTLFALDQGVENYRLLRGRGTEVEMSWFCGGHGVCLTGDGDPADVRDEAIAWFRRHLLDEEVDTGSRISIVDQRGVRWTADDYPDDADADELSASGSGTLALTAEGGAGPAAPPPGGGGIVGGLALGATPSRAENSVDIPIEAAEESLVVGAPTFTMSYRGTAGEGDRPQRVFVQIVDDATGLVVGNQITPVPIELDGDEHEVTVPLEMVVAYLRGGSTLTAQIVASTVAYAAPQFGGSIDVLDAEISLPVHTGAFDQVG